MVRIEYFGVWSDENRQAVRDVIAACIAKNMKISALPTYFEEESIVNEASSRKISEDHVQSEKNAMPVQASSTIYFTAEKRVGRKAPLFPAMRGEAGVKITILIYPAGNGRTRRQTVQEIMKNIALETGVHEKNIFVTLDAPPQERRSYAEER